MFKSMVEEAERIAIGGHIRPDGDCAGSCLGLWNTLQTWYPEKEISIYLEELPDCFSFLAGADAICHTCQEESYDLFISIDCGAADRLGFAEDLFHKAKKTICIDHHISNVGFADWNDICPEASSASELVYNLIKEQEISKEVAECLYLGIVHDTGVFQYSSTAPETMEAAAHLMRTGINGAEIIEKTYYEKTYAQNRILGRVLLDARLLLGGACIAASLSKETMDAYDVTPKDLEGIVSQLRMTKGVEVALFVYELGEQEQKASMRSNGKVDVSVIAQSFGGGGHKKAAGVTLHGTPEDVILQLTEKISLQL